MKIAKFKLYGLECVHEYREYMDRDKDWIRISDVVDVKFQDLPAEIIVPQEVAAIEAKIAAARDVFQQAISELEDEKSKLLAIKGALSPLVKSAQTWSQVDD